MTPENLQIESTGIFESNYGHGNPMVMRCKEAPLALLRNSLGHQIYQDGMLRITDSPLPSKGYISENEATRHNFAFLQLTGVEKGESNRRVASVSGGLTWDRQTSLEDAAKKLLIRMGGEDIVKMKRYGYKWVAFIETDRDASDFYERFINVPRGVWSEELPENIAEVQNRIQNKRGVDFETRQWFLNTFGGKKKGPLEQAFKKDDKRLFSWDCITTEDDIWAIDADGDSQPMSITSMALSEDTDENTRLMLLNMKDFLKGTSIKNRFWIEFNYGPDAVCCDASSNSQANFYKTKEFMKESSILQQSQAKLFPDLTVLITDNNVCSTCKKEKDSNHDCNQSVSDRKQND